jgi:hypothetical protein
VAAWITATAGPSDVAAWITATAGPSDVAARIAATVGPLNGAGFPPGPRTAGRPVGVAAG